MELTGDALLSVVREYADKLSKPELINKCGYGAAPADFYLEVIYANNSGMKEAEAEMEQNASKLAKLLQSEWSSSPRKYIIANCGMSENRCGYISVVLTALSRWKNYPLTEPGEGRKVAVFLEYEDDDKEDYIEISELDTYDLDPEGIKTAIGSFMQELTQNNGKLCGSFSEQSEEYMLLEQIRSYYVKYIVPESLAEQQSRG